MLRSSVTSAGDFRVTHYSGTDPSSIYRWTNPKTGRATTIAELSDGRFKIKRPDLFSGLVATFPHDELLLSHSTGIK